MPTKQNVNIGSIKPETKNIKKDRTRNCDWCGKNYTAKNNEQNVCCLKCEMELRMMAQAQQKPQQQFPFEKDFSKLLDLINMAKGSIFWGRMPEGITFLKEIENISGRIYKKFEQMLQP